MLQFEGSPITLQLVWSVEPGLFFRTRNIEIERERERNKQPNNSTKRKEANRDVQKRRPIRSDFDQFRCIFSRFSKWGGQYRQSIQQIALEIGTAAAAMAAVAMERTDEVIYCLVLLAFHSSRPVSFSASRVSIEFVWFYCFKDLLSCGPLQTIKRIQHVLPVGNSTSRPHSRSTYSRHYRTGVLSRCAKTSQLVFSLLFSFLVLFL